MKLTATVQKQIDTMSYEQMLRHRRFDPIGSDWWMGDVGAAMTAREQVLREQISAEEHTATSKHIGWKYE